MAESDVDITVGLKILNTELKALKKQITESLSGINIDLTATGEKTRGARINRALSGGLLSGNSQQREKVRADALAALDEQSKSAAKSIDKHNTNIVKTTDKIADLSAKLKDAIASEGDASDAAKSFAKQLASSERSLIKAQIKQAKLADEFTKLQSAIATFKTFAEKAFNPSTKPAQQFQADVRQFGGAPNGKVAAPTEKPLSPARIAAREASRLGRIAGSELATGDIDLKTAQSRVNDLVDRFKLKSEDASRVLAVFADKLESAASKVDADVNRLLARHAAAEGGGAASTDKILLNQAKRDIKNSDRLSSEKEAAERETSRLLFNQAKREIATSDESSKRVAKNEESASKILFNQAKREIAGQDSKTKESQKTEVESSRILLNQAKREIAESERSSKQANVDEQQASKILLSQAKRDISNSDKVSAEKLSAEKETNRLLFNQAKREVAASDEASKNSIKNQIASDKILLNQAKRDVNSSDKLESKALSDRKKAEEAASKVLFNQAKRDVSSEDSSAKKAENNEIQASKILLNQAKREVSESDRVAREADADEREASKILLRQANREVSASDARIREQARAVQKELDRFNKQQDSDKARIDAKIANEKGRAALRELKLQDKLEQAMNDVAKAQTERARTIRRLASQEASAGNVSGNTGFRAQFIGGGGGGIANALNKSSSGDQAALSRIILKQTGIVKDNEGALFGLGNTLNNTNKFTQQYASNLKLGQRAAFEFGVSAAQAADRLAAWAVPSLFIFNTISALRGATDQIIALDTQARRLAFFQLGDDNPFVALEKAGGAAAGTMENQIARSFKLINSEAIRTGIAIGEVTEAILEVTKVGRTAFEVGTVFEGVDKKTELVASKFLEATLGLVRIEGGALSASRAVEILNATLEQNNLETKDSIQIASLLNAAAIESSTNLDGLGTVVNRVGSAFANLQNTTPAETIQLAATAITRLGTNPSRAATALRQLSTLFTRFGKEIKEATGIEVVDSSGQLTGINEVLDALEKVRELRGTPGGFKIADLLAEAENIPDFQNLAEGVDDFRAKLAQVGGESSLLFTKNAVGQFLATNEAQAKSFKGTMESLNSTLIKFASDIKLGEAFAGFASGTATALSGVSSLIEKVQEFPKILSAVGSALTAVTAIFLSKKFVDAGAGFISASIGKNLGNVTKQIRETAFSDDAQFKGVEIVNQIQKEGFINQQKGNALREEANTILQRQVGIEAKIEAAETRLNVLRKSSSASVQDVARQEQKLNSLLDKKNANLTAELNLRKRIVAETGKQSNIESFTSSGRRSAIVAGGVAAGFVVAQGLASGIEDKKSRDTVQAALTGALVGGSAGATLGAAIGSVIPIVGTAIGGAVGGAIGGLGGAGLGIFQSINESQRELNDQKLNEKKIDEAVASQRQQLLRQSENRLKAAINLSKLEERLFKIQSELEISQLDLVEAQRKGVGVASAEVRVREKTTELIALQKQLQLDEIAIQEERINSENRLNEIKKRGSRLTSAINLVEQNSLERLRQKNVSAPIIRQVQFEFDRKKLQAEAAIVQEQLDKTTVRIQGLRGQTNRAQELRAEEERAKNLEEELSAIRFKSFEEEFVARKEILNLANEEQKKQIENFKNAAKEVASALSAIIADERELIQLISSRAQIDISISDVQRDLEQSLHVFDNGISRQISNAASSLDAIRRERTILEDSFSTQSALLGRAGVEPVNTAQINEAADNLSRALEGTAGKTDDQLSPDERQRIAVARADVDLIRARIQINQQLQAVEANRLKEIEKSVRDEIKVRRDLIEANKQLLSIEAKRGETLLNDPLEFFNQLKQSNNARSFLGRAGINGPENIVEKLSKLVQGNAGTPGALAVLREVEQGLKGAISQGFQLVDGISPEDLLRAFQAAIVGGAGSSKGIAAEDDIQSNADLIQKSNEQLVDILGEQRKVVNEQAKTNIALNQFNQNEAKFALENRKAAIELLGAANKQLQSAQDGFNKVSLKVEQLGTFIDRLLKTDEFSTQIGILDSSVQQIIALLQDSGSGIAGDRDTTKLTRAVSETFKQFGTSLSSEQTSQLVNRLGKIPFEQIAPILSGLQTDSETSDLSNGKIAASLRTVVDDLIKNVNSGQNPNIRGSVANGTLPAGFDESSSRAILSNSSTFEALLSNLARNTALLNTPIVRGNSDRADRIRKDNDVINEQLNQEIERISKAVANPELLNRIDTLVRAIESQRSEDARKRDAGLDIDPQSLADLLSKAIGDRSIVPSASASEERTNFVRAIEEAARNGVGTAFNDSIENLRVALADGVTINAQDINLKVSAEVQSKINSSPELLEAISTITGGNREETQRILRILQELIRLENQRGTALSAETTGAGG
jgi:hypothetical protein